jgi:hypothetical protein
MSRSMGDDGRREVAGHSGQRLRGAHGRSIFDSAAANNIRRQEVRKNRQSFQGDILTASEFWGGIAQSEQFGHQSDGGAAPNRRGSGVRGSGGWTQVDCAKPGAGSQIDDQQFAPPVRQHQS